MFPRGYFGQNMPNLFGTMKTRIRMDEMLEILEALAASEIYNEPPMNEAPLWNLL